MNLARFQMYQKFSNIVKQKRFTSTTANHNKMMVYVRKKRTTTTGRRECPMKTRSAMNQSPVPSPGRILSEY